MPGPVYRWHIISIGPGQCIDLRIARQIIVIIMQILKLELHLTTLYSWTHLELKLQSIRNSTSINRLKFL